MPLSSMARGTRGRAADANCRGRLAQFVSLLLLPLGAAVATQTPEPTIDTSRIAAIVLASEGRWSVERTPGVDVFVGQLLEPGTVIVASNRASQPSVRLALFHGQELANCQLDGHGRRVCAERLAVPDGPRLTSPLGIRLVGAAPQLPDALAQAALLAKAAGSSAGLMSAPALCTASGLDLALLFPGAPPGDYSLALRTEGEGAEVRCGFTHPRRHLCPGNPRVGYRPCRPGMVIEIRDPLRGWTALAAALSENDFLSARGELREFRVATAGWESREAVAALLNALVRQWADDAAPQ
jgi:hypothetical protein